MLSLQEISDRLEIQQLMIEYSTAIDSKDFDRLDQVFTPDAYIDYRVFGGIDGRYPEVKAWLKTSLAAFPHYYHMVGNAAITVTGDTATSKTICFNPMVADLANGETQVFFCGLWYIDRHIRTPQGWRMTERVEESCFVHNVPPHIKAAPD
jgi:3-phenylpropionate/cinnamic acid dioxygenase small subunit